jgi:transglutaminase-like putative cysteine protease
MPSCSIGAVPADADAPVIRWLGRLTLVCCLAISGCAAVPPPDPTPLFTDALFQRPAQWPDPAQVFALDEPMKRHLDAQRRAAGARDGAEQVLLAALYEAGHLRLEYDGTHTRTASEAFAARAGNCLSLVVMTAAFAKELGLSVRYQSAVFDEIWSRHGAAATSTWRWGRAASTDRWDCPTHRW